MSASTSNYGATSSGHIATAWEESEISGRGKTTPQQMMAQKRFENTQAQVDEVVGIMKINMVSVLERDGKVTELEQRGETLLDKANEFQTGTSKLRRKQCFQNYKTAIIIGTVSVLILSALIWANMP